MDTRAIDEFVSFLDKVIEPSIVDMDNLEESSRKHIQKLVYTNLVDRFDSTIDQLFHDNVRHPELLPEALKNANEPITQKDLYELLLRSDDLTSVLDSKLREGISNNITRNSHSQKLQSLFRLCAEDAGVHNLKPRVNVSTGRILDKIKPQREVKSPYSIIGYADWLYSRRNSIVHGSGSSSFLPRDIKRLKERFKVSVAKTSKISIASIKVTKSFYSDTLKLFTDHCEE